MCLYRYNLSIWVLALWLALLISRPWIFTSTQAPGPPSQHASWPWPRQPWCCSECFNCGTAFDVNGTLFFSANLIAAKLEDMVCRLRTKRRERWKLWEGIDRKTVPTSALCEGSLWILSGLFWSWTRFDLGSRWPRPSGVKVFSCLRGCCSLTFGQISTVKMFGYSISSIW